jgi:hypothetical protein
VLKGLPQGFRLIPSRVAGVLISAFLIAALPRAIADSVSRFAAAVLHRHESDTAADARLFGAETTAAVGAIRGALRPGEPYILLDDDCGYARFWLRNALAPHPALLITHQMKRTARLKLVLTESLRVVVCNGDDSPPDLYERREFLAEQGVPDGR